MESEQMPISQDNQNVDKEMHYQSRTKQHYYSLRKLRIILMSSMVLCLIMGSIYFYIINLDEHSLHVQVIDHQNHQIYIAGQFTHDEQCYTQGLSFINQTHVLESCGLYGKSYFKILKYSPNNVSQDMVEVYRSQLYPKEISFQGSVKFTSNNCIYILTRRQNIVLVFEEVQGKLVEQKRLNWNHPGRGITHNNTHLILSQGSSSLYITNQKMQLQQTINVTDNESHPISGLNQLEYVSERGQPFIYANIYPKDQVVKINLLTGKLKEVYKPKHIPRKDSETKNAQILNGIAYQPKSNRFLLTGKNLKYFYLIQAL